MAAVSRRDIRPIIERDDGARLGRAGTRQGGDIEPAASEAAARQLVLLSSHAAAASNRNMMSGQRRLRKPASESHDIGIVIMRWHLMGSQCSMPFSA